MNRDPSAFPSVAAAAVAAALRRAAQSARETHRAQPSFAEASLWSLVGPGQVPGARNRAWGAMIDGPLDLDALRAALGDLVSRHAGLRAGYLEDGGRLWRTAVRNCWVRMPIDDFSHGPAGIDRVATAALWARRMASRAIDLAQAPLMRLGVARFADDAHAVVVVTHRLIADRCGLSLLLRELGERYALHLRRDADDLLLPPPPVMPAPGYAGWADAQRARVEDPSYKPVVDWWSHRLHAALPLALRTDHERPARPTHAGGRVPVTVDAARAQALRTLAWQAGVTPFVAWLSLWQVVLAQWSDQHDFTIATPVTHRERAESALVFGCLSDQMALRADLGGNPAFTELLTRNRETVREAVGLRGAPWGLVAPDIVARSSFSMLAPPALSLSLAGCRIDALAMDEAPCFHDLSLHLEPRGDEFGGVLAYARDLFEPETAERIAAHVGVLLDAVLARPDVKVADLPR